MGSRPLLAAAVIYGWLVVPIGPVCAAGLYAQLFPLTGEVRIANKDAAPVPFVFYSITSAAGALEGGSEFWRSIAGNYDASGNGLVDPTHDWFVLSDRPTELTEAVFSGPGGSVPPTRAISLGHIWSPGAALFPDLAFEIRADQQAIPVTIELAVDGDYSLDQVVDQADYVIWRKHLGSTSTLLADGNLDGVVDAADYDLWQQNFGQTVPLPPYGTGSGSSPPKPSAHAGMVPEPTSDALLLVGIGWLLMCIDLGRRPSHPR